jgi:DNA-binding NarL/FixJ family response regulator
MRVLICDDQSIIRDGLAMLLNLERDIDVVGCAENGHEAVQLTKQLHPQLVLMDLKMPGTNGVEATRQIRVEHPNTAVLVLTTYDDDEWVFDALRAGAAGYILKDTPREELLKAIRGTVEGKTHIDPAVAGKLLPMLTNSQSQAPSLLTMKLTKREGDVLRLIASGQTNPAIAARLHLTEGTVRNHVSAILDKLGVTDRTQAAVLALQYGMFERRASHRESET